MARIPLLLRIQLWTVVAMVVACGGPSVAERPPAPAPITAPAPATATPELVAIDMFGTDQITLPQLLASCGQELRAFGDGVMRSDRSITPEAIIAKISALGDFADVDPAVVGYYEPGGMKYYLTVDFVDRKDAARRMPFLPRPTGTYPDPDGLLADWRAYEAKVFELLDAKRMSIHRVDCPAFHCLGDSSHPEVKQLADKFAALVPAHVEELATILRDDREASHRASAAFLLAYSKDGPALLKLMVLALRDRSPLVRNNAMRVISDIAFYHPELDVPIDPILESLDYPSTLDRNKASAVLAGLLEQPGGAARRVAVTTRAGATILAMLRLQQPNNHDFAYRILKSISGQTFGERDYAAWEAWLQTARTAP